jgi:hypothetical protein
MFKYFFYAARTVLANDNSLLPGCVPIKRRKTFSCVKISLEISFLRG